MINFISHMAGNHKEVEKTYLPYMYTLFSTIMIGTYLLAYKMIAVGNISVSAGIFIFPINYAITDIVTEVYGFQQTLQLLKYSFFSCVLFVLVVPTLALLPAPTTWDYQEHYRYIFMHVYRFFIANTFGILIGIVMNSYLVAKWHILLQGKHFWLRSMGASTIGEFITSLIADILAFLGTVNKYQLVMLMVTIYVVKVIYALILAWPNTLIAMHLKLNDPLHRKKINFDYNPFKIKTI